MPPPLPVGVLEAKQESEEPLNGMAQAKKYADCQLFDVKYVFATTGRCYGDYDKFGFPARLVPSRRQPPRRTLRFPCKARFHAMRQ